ncbi:Outer membrane protein beta-barrel domain-containing protein [Pedobacter steynii]|uniref:Outer membrane protein beta-barrel domain-containing protein n=1 Tax=Pedobacter steynii TaxID=430522 RepID=A0A1H0I7R4_9SPHI|nr:outer membrane beta-barrel protein [Pedobacter steynii]NQX42818.1 outer membrane beta-barrel protein [Pedobacter steynii]SDO27320.1 Outer membrane protein beta-barrel domain-containing protein [Pedobacter steynii]
MKMKLLLSLMCLLSVATVKAQNWGGGIDDNNLHFGFTFQYVSSEYKILKKVDWKDVDVQRWELRSDVPGGFSSISSKPSAGFGIGFVVNQKIHDNVDVRLTPILVFNDRILNYRFEEPPGTGSGQAPIDVQKKLETTFVDFPLSLKIKSNRRNNFRAYMMGGVKYTADISSKKKSDNNNVTDPLEKFVNNRRNFLSYEAGLGMDLYFEYFKMSPEIKLSYSFDSVKKNEAPHVFSTPIDKLMLRHVTFSLFFE